MNSTLTDQPGSLPLWALPLATGAMALCLVLLFAEGLSHMVGAWNSPDYSHGWLIPPVALYMAWQQRQSLYDLFAAHSGQVLPGVWFGLVFLTLSLLLTLVGELATLYTLVEYGFVFTLWSLIWLALGWRGCWLLAPAMVYLLFMVPLPSFLYNNLSAALQLWSSELGVLFIRAMGVSVYLSGNIIDLGVYQLQVAEACSGLRYLFPLLSFCYLAACFYRRSWWLKGIILLSALPITLLMNSIRIALIGLSVDVWGIEMAEGVLHSFEGWLVFLGCIVLLGLEVWLVERLCFRNAKPWQRLDISAPPALQMHAGAWSGHMRGIVKPLTAGLLLLVALLPLHWMNQSRAELVPERALFSSFPLIQGAWIGRESAFSAEIVSALRFSDYLNVDYVSRETGAPVNLYVAWYDSQRKGASIHSPRSCIPGDGWEIQAMETHAMHSALGLTPAAPDAGQGVFRQVIIQKGLNRQLVYYWFNQRGRIFANEYLAKWYLLEDSLLMNRTDGALVRLVTPLGETESLADAQDRLNGFLQDFHGTWSQWIPGREA